MIIEWLPLKDALNMAKALKLPEQVAVQYFAFDWNDFEGLNYRVLYDLKPSSFKFLLKNKSFQIRATSEEKTCSAIRTLDLNFLKKYIEQVEPDLNDALLQAAYFGFTDAVKLLLSDSRVEDPSARNNEALVLAARKGHLDIVKLLLSDAHVDPSAQNNKAFIKAAGRGHLEIVKLLLSDSRVGPSAQNNKALILAARKGHLDIVKLLLSDDRVDPSAQNNEALVSAALVAHSEILEKVLPPYFNI
jgi:hypothetical protein